MSRKEELVPTYRIDTHHHFLPPRYVSAIGEDAIARTLVSARAPAWSPSMSIEAMDRNGIQTAVLSISAPGFTCCDSDDAAALCRHCNEYAAQMKLDHVTRFGSFASLPLPNIDLSLKEIAFSFDELRADGVCLLTNYDGRYLGNEHFSPLFEELNRRKAVVYVHPTEAPFTCLCGLPPASLEFPFDTTRAIASLLFSGAFARYRDVKFIFSHAGGTIPFLAGRLARLETRDDFASQIPEGVLAELRRLYFDTALSATDVALQGLLQLTSIDHVLFGSDYPHAPEATMNGSIRSLSNFGIEATGLLKIERENALRLLPSLLPNAQVRQPVSIQAVP
ncbi:putative TIM-barrel fold metal-dependent hydrolase [Bradyrhizobium sp. USDA 4463]